MKKILVYTFVVFMTLQATYAMDTVFDSMDKATEVKLQPAVDTSKTTSTTNVNSTYRSTTLKEQKFNNALINLDDAQVELRQELAVVTSKYNEALNEKC